MYEEMFYDIVLWQWHRESAFSAYLFPDLSQTR